MQSKTRECFEPQEQICSLTCRAFIKCSEHLYTIFINTKNQFSSILATHITYRREKRHQADGKTQSSYLARKQPSNTFLVLYHRYNNTLNPPRTQLPIGNVYLKQKKKEFGTVDSVSQQYVYYFHCIDFLESCLSQKRHMSNVRKHLQLSSHQNTLLLCNE